jgi:MFS family permease
MSRQGSFEEFRLGWPIVLASMLGIGLGLSPLPYYTIGVIAPHLAKEFGWSMAQIMGGVTTTTLVVLWAGPMVGALAIRFGVRRIILPSIILFSCSFMALSLLTGSLTQYYLTWAAVAIFGAGTLPITWTRTVNQWFDRRKGLALGLSLMGTGLFGFFSKSITAALIASYGWRGAYVGLGLLPLLIALPVAFFLFKDKDEGTASLDKPILLPGGMSLTQALKDWRFWLIALTLAPISLALGGPVPNMENILKSGGMESGTVLQLTPFIGLSALAGRLIGGWLIDRFWAPAVAFVIIATPGISCWFLAHGALDFNMALISIILIGFALGIEFDLMAFFVARYFGMKNYTAIFGLLYSFFALGAGFGPLLYGREVDISGNYDRALMASFATLIICAIAILFLGKYRSFADETVT